MASLNQLKELTRVRLYGFWREPEAMFWVFLFPLVLAGVLGFAFRSGGVVPTTIGVVNGPQAAAMSEVLALDEHLEEERFETREEAYIKLRRGAVDALFESIDPPEISMDPTRPDSEMARMRVLRALALSAGAEDAPLEIDEVTEKGSRYVDFLFPGLLGMNLMGTGMWGVGFAIADIRRRKFLKRMLVTPMSRGYFFMSFILSRLVFLLFELLILTSFGAWVLGVPFRGDILSYLIVSFTGAILFAGMGLLVASRAKTIEGVSGIMNFVMMPMWLASGVFFSYERFPEFLHPAIKALPLTSLNDALRAVMIDGETVFQQGLEMGIMAAWTVVCFVIALKIFRWG